MGPTVKVKPRLDKTDNADLVFAKSRAKNFSLLRISYALHCTRPRPLDAIRIQMSTSFRFLSPLSSPAATAAEFDCAPCLSSVN